MENTYAEALWEMVEGGMSPAKAVHALRDVLVVRGREVLFPRIARAFERIAVRKSARTSVTLHIAHEGDERRARADVKKTLAEMRLESAEINDVKIDTSLIGGWRLEDGERLIDASFKKQLLSIYNRVTHA